MSAETDSHHKDQSMSKGLIVYMGGMELPDKNAAAHRIVANACIFRDLGYEVILLGLDRDSGVPGVPKRVPIDHFGFECWSMAYPSSMKAMYRHLAGTHEVLGFLKGLLARGLKSVICYNYPAVAQYRIQNFCRGNGVKHIADVTEWYDSSGGGALFRLAKFTDTWLRMNLVHMRCDALITTSEFVTRFYADRQANIVELPTLFDTTEFPTQTLRAEDDGVLRLIYVGRPFEPSRVNAKRTNLKERLDIVVESVLALQGTRPIRLDIYGIRADEYIQVFPENREQLMRSDSPVHFHGRIENSAARQLIAEADFSIFFRDPNRVNLSGFPTKLAESISCGTPVITSALPNLMKYEELGTVFLVEPGEGKACLSNLLNFDRPSVLKLKKICAESKAFDYHRHADKVEHFNSRVGI